MHSSTYKPVRFHSDNEQHTYDDHVLRSTIIAMHALLIIFLHGITNTLHAGRQWDFKALAHRHQRFNAWTSAAHSLQVRMCCCCTQGCCLRCMCLKLSCKCCQLSINLQIKCKTQADKEHTGCKSIAVGLLCSCNHMVCKYENVGQGMSAAGPLLACICLSSSAEFMSSPSLLLQRW